MDETFHGYNKADALELTSAVTTVQTLMHSAHAAHGDFRLHYSDTVLCAGNGRLWADWAVSGIRSDALFAMPYIGWFSQRHRLALKFGWIEATLLVGDTPVRPYRTISWYEADAIPVTEFISGAGRVRAWCALAPAEPGLCLHLEPDLPEATRDAVLVLRGATTLGEEAGSPFDAVNGTVGDCPPLPSEIAAQQHDRQITFRNAPAGVAAELHLSVPVDATFTHGRVETGSGDRRLSRQKVGFELRAPLRMTAPNDGAIDVQLSFRDEPAATPCRPQTPTLATAKVSWADAWSCLDPLRTPDARLTAGLRRAAIYARSLLVPIDGTSQAAALADHVEWPVDCARDAFHIANALLLLKPDLVKQHLAFYFLDAIPQAGVGKSYVPTGESRGHRAARLLDLASYPLLELWRYWCATRDDTFVANAKLRGTALTLVDDVTTWRDARTGMLTSTERSSDERCIFPCFVPGNAMFAASLCALAQLCDGPWQDPAQAKRLRSLAAELTAAVYHHAVVDDPEFGRMFAFEIGGRDEALLYDHADMPNLLSLARLGFCAPDDPVFRNTVRFAYSSRNQGFRGTADGKYRQLCDGSKTMPSSPWALGALGQLMSGTADADAATRLLDWLRDALTPALQLPEICDKHTARPVQRYWFGWPTGLLLMAYIETICGVKIGPTIRVEPLIPAGWSSFASPRLRVRGQDLSVEYSDGRLTVRFAGQPLDPDADGTFELPEPA